MKKTLIIITVVFMTISASAQADDFYFFDDFENGLTEWTIGGRRLAGQNVANTVSRHGSMMGHLYKTSFTEVTFQRIFEYDPLLRFSFDMEAMASSTSPPAPNYYGLADVRIIFGDNGGVKLGEVKYATATTSYIFDIATNNPTISCNPVTAGVLEHYNLTMDELLSQITIDESAISEITMQFRCYSSTYPYPIVSAELWVDNLTVTNIPEASTLTADADGPYTIYVGDVLTLDASGSIDDDNDIVSYLWDLDDDGIFETDAGDQAVFEVDYAYLESLGLGVDNSYTITLVVTDSEDQNDIDESTLTILSPSVIEVPVDIKPMSCPNPLNVKSKGVFPVAVIGSGVFDVNEIDVASVELLGIKPIRSSYEDVSTPLIDANECDCSTEGSDGYMDLTLKFETQAIVEALGEVGDGDELALYLTGSLYDDTQFEGSDCVIVKKKGKP